MARWFKNIQTGCEYEIDDEALIRRLVADPLSYAEIQPPAQPEPEPEPDAEADAEPEPEPEPKRGRAKR